MSLTLAIGLFLQVTAVSLVVARVGRHLLAYIGALVVLVAFVYHGTTEVVQFLFPGRNPYRFLVGQPYVDAWVLVAGFALLAFALTYAAVVRVPARPVLTVDALRPLYRLRWPVFALASVTVLTGLSGMLGGLDPDSAMGYWLGGISGAFGQYSLVLALLVLVYRSRSRRSLLAILILGCVLLAMQGSRLGVVTGILMALTVLFRLGITLDLGRLSLLGAAGLVLMLAISSARAFVGRDVYATGSGAERVGGLVGGAQQLASGSDVNGTEEYVLEDVVYRFDGNAFNGMVAERYSAGSPPVGLLPLAADAALAVPSFINPLKLAIDPRFLNEEFITALHFGFPLDIDYTSGGLGMLYAMFGGVGACIAAAVAGWLLARLDNWLQRDARLFAVLVAIGAAKAAAMYEQTFMIYFETFRAVVAFYLVARVLLLFLEPRRQPALRPAATVR